MLVLFESPAGFGLFQVLDEGKLKQVDDLWKLFESREAASKIVKLKAFTKFANTTEALGAATALVDSKLNKGLRKFLKANCLDGELLALADSKLGNIVKEKLGIDCVNNSTVMELMRGLRSLAGELITGLDGYEMAPMSLGLSHSLSRYKLKFSPDKVDTMIVQAIGLLDDLDKELNTYVMRVREWYGWHFPELARIVQDNIQYARVVKLTGSRTEAAKLDYSAILAEELEAEMKEAAVISMGTEVSDHDMLNIKALCDQIIALAEYRVQLYDYLRSRMNAIAPNLTVLVGELVGARLIAHAGSLINLAKHPASTVQILGAEKALFRALKTKHDTPKYGLIYHASLIGQAAPKFKGKISRVLAAKSSLAIRLDALGDESGPTIGIDNRLKVEQRLRQLEGRMLSTSSSGAGKAKSKYDKDKKNGLSLVGAAKTYNPAADLLLAEAATAGADSEGPVAKKRKKVRIVEVVEEEAEAEKRVAAPEEAAEEPKPKKVKKKKVSSATIDAQGELTAAVEETEEVLEVAAPTKKTKKKVAAEEVVQVAAPTKKKKRKAAAEESAAEEVVQVAAPTKKTKRKKAAAEASAVDSTSPKVDG